MIFSLRNILFGLLAFVAIIGAVVVYISASVFYQNLQEQVVSEKSIAIRSADLVIFGTGEDGIIIITPEVEDILKIHAMERGVDFFRLVDLENQVVVASSNEEDVGEGLGHMPQAVREEVVVETFDEGGKAAVELVYQSNSRYALWLAIERVFLTGPTMVVTVQQGFLFLVMILLMAVALWTLGMGFIVQPLRQLQASLVKVGREDFSVRLPAGPPNEFGTLFSAFNTMAHNVQRSIEREKEVEGFRREFVTIAAHQLRTPLSAVKWTFEMLNEESENLTEEQKEYIHNGSQSTESMVLLVGDLLNMARVERGSFQFDLKEYALQDVLAIVEELIEDEKPNMDAKGTSLSFQKPNATQLQRKVSIDKTKIFMVLENLLDNAVRYTLQGGTIAVRMSVDEHAVQFSIKDTGIGVPKDQMNRLFTKFFRGKEAVRMETEGSGLGLFLSKTIVEAHKGKIWAESEEGKGSTFYFTLPLIA